ncbi:type II toxin-antitoxin system prevent-host-death family antitoxin [Nocardia sp. NPDC056611]|uniref:type II toxin-antitoxin system prevent-host-death family antitoxin n=1 Tax=Nocardia sp. NPDC056611 TaxID=3345877 RepID=UPI003670ADDF
MEGANRYGLDDLRNRLEAIVRGVAAAGGEAIITAGGCEMAVIISVACYERLHEHADTVDAVCLGSGPQALEDRTDQGRDVE